MAGDRPRSLAGRLLVAAPSLTDPNFAHTVVLLLGHGEEGALGVVLNRPSDVAVAATLPTWAPLAAGPAVVFVGGPVHPHVVVALGRADSAADGLQQLVPGVAAVDVDEDPSHFAGVVDAIRLFAGYGGWGVGQLEQELDAGGWFVVAAGVDDVFTAHPEALWRQVLARQGGIFRTIPEDPSHN
jgi:putative transcriptional regulator